MTTFQILMDAFGKALTHLIPISKMLQESISQGILHWSLPDAELEFLILLTASASFLVFFRFDWLGMISALVTSIARPMSLKADRRTLDQHTLIFLLLVLIPSLIANHFMKGLAVESELHNHPLLLAGMSIALGLLLRFAFSWNKRIFGLNHLRLGHGVLIGLISLFSAHPGFPLIALLWIGFAINNYHYEAIFKYSMLILGLTLITSFLEALGHIGLKSAIETVGHLNSVAVLVIGFSVFWIGLENLQKTLSETTYKTFQWLNLAMGLYFIAFYFMRG